MDVYIRCFSTKDDPIVINVEPDATVADLKKKIAEDFGVEYNKIKLIFESKILSNTTLVISVEYNESTPIIFYAPKSLLSTSSPPLSASSPPLSTSSPPLSASSPPLSASSPPLSASSPPLSASSFCSLEKQTQQPEGKKETTALSNICDEKKIKTLEEMGFERKIIIETLKKCDGDLSLAIELLINGNQDQNSNSISSIYDLHEMILEAASNNPEIANEIRAGKAIPVKMGDKTFYYQTNRQSFDKYLQKKALMGAVESPVQFAITNNVDCADLFQNLNDDDQYKVQMLLKEGHDFDLIMQYFNACGNDLEQTRAILQSI